MYFVTIKRPGYVLFSTTPSERGAVGVTDTQAVHVLVREGLDRPWTVVAEWQAAAFSPTDFMVAWRQREEPSDLLRLLDVVPADIRQDRR